MRIGTFQYSAGADLCMNNKKILDAIHQAAEQRVRLLVFQECATCGYPPVERATVDEIDFEFLKTSLEEVKSLARIHNMYIALGTVTRRMGKCYNSIQVIGDDGRMLDIYDKRALWGWDADNFTRGDNQGIYLIDGVNIGFRICFEVRFPEYFRELYNAEVKLCFVSFCDVGDNENPIRYNVIQSHLLTRAVENVMTVVSVNSTSKYQTAPTAVFAHTGEKLLCAPHSKEHLLVYDYEQPQLSFGMRGLIYNNDLVMSDKSIKGTIK